MTLPPELPTGPMDPLAPRAGALDEVRSAARAQRNRRRAVLGGSVSVLLLALALPLAFRGDGDGRPQHLQTADDEHDGDRVPDVSSTSSTSTTTAEAPGSGPTTTGLHCIDYCGPGPGPADPVATERLEDSAYLVGRAVDPDGAPLANITVYSGTPLPNGAVRDALTDQGGWYTIPCPSDAVVLSGVVISTFAGDHQLDSVWAPVMVSAPGGRPLAEICGRGSPVVTTMQHGGVIEGTVHDEAWPEKYGGGTSSAIVHPVAVELRDLPWAPTDCNGMPTCFFLEVIGGYGPDFAFRAVGVPPGDHDLYVFGNAAGSFNKVTVHVAAGATTHVELEVPAWVDDPPAA